MARAQDNHRMKNLSGMDLSDCPPSVTNSRGVNFRSVSGLILFAIFFLSSGTISSQTARSPQRISFTRNAISSQIHGRLLPKQEGAYYVVKARAGQRMVVHAASLTKPGDLVTLVFVTSPSGQSDGEKTDLSFNQSLTESGDYTIRVARNMMAGNGNGTGEFLLEVIIF
jgi:hypothetical protein